MRRRTRALLSSLMSVPMLAGVVGITQASPAAAQETPDSPLTDLTCTISGTADISPGVGLLSQPQEIAGEVQGGTEVSPATPCTSLTGVPYQGFTMELTGTGHHSCATALLEGGLSGIGTVTWDNGDTSTVEWSITNVFFVPVVNVTYTGGALEGASTVVGGVPASLTGNCATAPVTSMGFGGVAELVRLGS